MQQVNIPMHQFTPARRLPPNHLMHQLTNLGIHDTTMTISRPHEDQPTSVSTIPCDPLSITTNLFLIIEPGLLLSTLLLLLLLTHSVTNYELGPYPRARLSIDLIHSAEVAHFTHTTEPMPSHSHSGGPTTFQ